MDICEITREPIDKPGLEQRLLTGTAGAMVTFDGVVRNQTGGRPVMRLQYEAYAPMAVKEMQRIVREVRERWPEVDNVGIIHRFGELEISESSVVIVYIAGWPSKPASTRSIDSNRLFPSGRRVFEDGKNGSKDGGRLSHRQPPVGTNLSAATCRRFQVTLQNCRKGLSAQCSGR